jgi:BioD-like phosphotransacetylase family protein
LIALYVISLEGSAGKTAICAGLGKHLLNDGKTVGFFKPTRAGAKSPPAEAIDSDAVFMRDVFALDEPESSLCPVISGDKALANRIKEAYAGISRGKDVVIIEDVRRQGPDGKPIEASHEIVEALDARVIIVEGYSKELPGGKLVSTCRDFGEYLLGVVLNKVPRSQLEHVRGEMLNRFGETKLSILGVLPEDRVLSMLTVGELAGHVQGEILNCTEKSVEMVENFMLGAMCVDPGPQYFGRKDNKAVIVRGERPDMQLAALETSARCLVLAGNKAPIPTVLSRAEEKGIPIILAGDDTSAIVSRIEDALGKTSFNQEKKLPKLMAIMEQYFDFQAVYKGLGLANR